MANAVFWTEQSKRDLIEIKRFFDHRNQSTYYSQKLFRLFKATAGFVGQYPLVGFKTDFEDVRGILAREYILFYQVDDGNVTILTVWDTRQDPGQLNELLRP